jgi:hypothetical protein
MKVKHNFKKGVVFRLNNLFWEDVCKENIPLRLIFPRLYNLFGRKQCLVSECQTEGEWTMNFTRPLSEEEAAQWDSLVDLLENVQLNDHKDKVV